jgi:hypothetical protein
LLLEARRSVKPNLPPVRKNLRPPLRHDLRTVALRIPALAGAVLRQENGFMRGPAGILIGALILGGVYYFYLRKMPTAAPGTAATQAPSLIGVENDLLQIARAERLYILDHEGCGSLDQLLSSGALAMTRSGRDGYSYSIECSGANFIVRAQHPPATENSPVRYPAFTVDETLQVRETN